MWRLAILIVCSISLAIGLGLVIMSHDSNANRFGPRGGGGFPAPIQSVSFGPTFSLYGNGACPATKCVSADTFFSTWDDLGNIVMTSDDTTLWNATSASGCCNVMLSTLSNFSTSMTGTTVRTFVSESGQPGFGHANQTGGDSATWKVTGMMSVQGMLILSVGRQYDTYNPPPPYPQELASSLWGSTDHGATWSPTTPSCDGCTLGSGTLTSPPYTFSNQKFVHVFFIQYGQDYRGQAVDRSDQFVYAMSPDYSSAHLQSPNLWYSDVINLARITIANLKANPAGSTSSWQFYQGGDGSLDANWGALSTTVPAVSTPGHFANFLAPSVQYLPAFGQYLMLQSSDVARGANDTGWNVFTASHPWGPWTLLQQTIIPATPSPAPNGATGFYWPGIIPSSVATDGGIHIVALSSANFTVASYYTMYIVPITVH